MEHILQRLDEHAIERARQPALVDTDGAFDFEQLQQAVQALAGQLDGGRIGLLLDNGCAWAVADLAIARRGAICVPIPPYFSPTQIAHLIHDAALDLLITDASAAGMLQRLAGTDTGTEIEVAGRRLCLLRPPQRNLAALPAGTCKITYTSGTTGQPRGVCISGAAMDRVSADLGLAAEATIADSSMALLPMSTLLQNIGGLYAPLITGSRAALPSMAYCGFEGSSRVRPDALIGALHRFAPTSLILVPQLLKLLVEAVAAGAALPGSLRFVAVGGAPCSQALIGRAWTFGIPVYEGYGLSEASSVVSLNTPAEVRIGSVGRPLPHAQVRIADDGEIIVSGELFNGYLGTDRSHDGEWATGDLGSLDDAGFLHVTGRKKTAYATAFGRNVSPEWVESELLGHAAILQAAVFGEGQASNVAVLVPQPAATRAQIDAAVRAANARLPDYAHVAAWMPARAPFSPVNGLARSSGAPDRTAIAREYASELESLYAGNARHVRS